MNPTLTNVKKLVAQMGCTIETDRLEESTRHIVDAPEGMQFRSSGETALVCVVLRYPNTRLEALADLMERLEMGLEPEETEND